MSGIEAVVEPTDIEFSALLDQRDPNRLQQEPPPDPRARRQEPTPEPEEAPEEIAEPVAAQPSTDDLPEKYQGKSAAEIARMHQELEQRLGTQGQELGELRGLKTEVQQLRDYVSQLSQPEPEPQYAPITQDAVDWVDESVITNPVQTLQWVEANQPALYERALQAWASLDPISASRYDTQRILAQRDAQWEQKMAAVQGPVQQSLKDQQLAAAYSTVVARTPDAAKYADALPVLLQENPHLGDLLNGDDQALKERVLDNLFALAKARGAAQPEAPQTPPAEVPDTNLAKVQATVVSASSQGERGGQGEAQTQWKGQAFLRSESTSIADELARNRAR